MEWCEAPLATIDVVGDELMGNHMAYRKHVYKLVLSCSYHQSDDLPGSVHQQNRILDGISFIIAIVRPFQNGSRMATKIAALGPWSSDESGRIIFRVVSEEFQTVKSPWRSQRHHAAAPQSSHAGGPPPGTPKSSPYRLISLINNPFWGTPTYGNPQMVKKAG